MDKSFRERRKHTRIYRNFILGYHEKGRSTVRAVSQVNNVSKGGMNFSSTYPLKEGVVIIMELKTPFIADSIRLEGVVLECKEKIAGIIFEVRMEFQGVSQEALSVLEKIESYGKVDGD